MSAPVVWFEVMGQDADKLKGFYGELFQWQFKEDAPMPDYGLVETSEGVPGGVGAVPKGPGWATFYIKVNDLDETIEQVSRLGGKLLSPVQEIPNGDRVAIIADPEGHPVGLVA